MLTRVMGMYWLRIFVVPGFATAADAASTEGTWSRTSPAAPPACQPRPRSPAAPWARPVPPVNVPPAPSRAALSGGTLRTARRRAAAGTQKSLMFTLGTSPHASRRQAQEHDCSLRTARHVGNTFLTWVFAAEA